MKSFPFALLLTVALAAAAEPSKETAPATPTPKPFFDPNAPAPTVDPTQPTPEPSLPAPEKKKPVVPERKRRRRSEPRRVRGVMAITSVGGWGSACEKPARRYAPAARAATCHLKRRASLRPSIRL